MSELCQKAIDIVNELHTERLDYETEYLPLINALLTLQDFEEIGVKVEFIKDLIKLWNDGQLVKLPCKVGAVTYKIEPLWLQIWVDKNCRCKTCKNFHQGSQYADDIPCCKKSDDKCCKVIVSTEATFSDIAAWMDNEEFGKTVFLTYAEAEQALKHMEER